MDDNPLKDAMLALRNSPAPPQAPPRDVPIEPAGPPPGASIDRSTAPPLLLLPIGPSPDPAAPPPGPPPGAGFSANGKRLGRPKKAPIPLIPEIVSNMSELNEEIKDLNVKDHLTEKEMLFIEIFLAGGCSREEAMTSSGYGDYSQSHRLALAKKIVAKYESLVGEHRKTFRAVGAGEVAVAQGLLDLATTSKSEMVRLNAWTAIGKILGLTQDVVAVNQGIQIIIKGREDHSGRPAVQVRQEAPKAIPKTMAILK